MNMIRYRNGQSQSEAKPKGRFTGERLLRERPRVYRKVVELLAEPGMSINQITKLCRVSAFHIWDRTQRGIFPKGTFEATAGALLGELLRTPRGAAWWRTAKHIGFPPGFVSDVDAVVDKT